MDNLIKAALIVGGAILIKPRIGLGPICRNRWMRVRAQVWMLKRSKF
jgi:hypothetical protein